MKTKIIALAVLVLFISVSIISISNTFALAGNGEWITKYQINDGTTGNLIYSKDFATGAVSGSPHISNLQELKVTVTINVATNNPSSSLTLSTGLQHSSSLDHYWTHDASDGYTLGGSYNPNSPSFSFSQAAGTLIVTCTGIASGQTTTTSNGVTLHKAVPVSLVALKDPGNTLLDEIKLNITDAAINEFNTKLAAKEDALAGFQGSGVDPTYVGLYESILTGAQAVADQGLTDNANRMLDSLDVAGTPASGVMQILFLPLIAVFAVIAVLFAFMFMRNRGKVGYYRLVIEDQIKDLEGLTLRASKIDRTLSSNLSGIEDRLKRLVGM
ncbi:MAG TPA: hypothetical protein VK209_08095 [Candidatus Sulfotelmatobacter sp.]|nr:hypothetical protein [Candidatus Sulfotelmatobacter sp.]